MIKSMTGFGKAVVETEKSRYRIEIRTLNSKQLDINLRTPVVFKDKELEMRGLINQELIRGKVDLSISMDQNSAESASVVNESVAMHYFNELKRLSQKLGIQSSDDLLPAILKLPDVFISPEQTLDTHEWENIVSGLKEALTQVNEFRISEGKNIETDSRVRINIIKSLLTEVEPFELKRTDYIKERIRTNLQSFSNDVQQDMNRLEQEMIYYIEKLDITEEKVRLLKHCDYFLETLKSEEAQGKKLGFISQEIGREINTMGSKANDVNIQKIVVLMKDELEKIKEQLYNIL